MTQAVTDEQFGHYCRRIHDLSGRVLRRSVPFQRTMDGLQALVEGEQRRLVGLVGPILPKGTIALSLEIDLTLSMEEMIRSGEYSNERLALQDITEDRYPIIRDVRTMWYSTTVLLIPPYREGITFKEQEEEMASNHLRQYGVAETLAIGRQYPGLQLIYCIIGLASTWHDPGGLLYSPALWSGGARRELDPYFRNPVDSLREKDRCVAALIEAA